MHYAVILLFLPTVALGQESNEAEKLFRKMENKLKNAASIQYEFEGVMEGRIQEVGEMKILLKGSFIQAKGGKVRFTLKRTAKATAFEERQEFGLISDGERIRALVEPRKSLGNDNSPAPKYFAESINVMLSRTARSGGSVLGGSTDKLAERLLEGKARDGKGSLDIEKEIPLTGFKLGEVEQIRGKAARLIQYEISQFGDRPDPVQVKLWIDEKTGLPLQRQMSWGGVATGGIFSLFETYSNLKLDAEIDPETFKLPK